MTALGAAPEPAVAPTEHLVALRRDRRPTRVLETALAALFMLTALAVTVVLLGLQWLGDQSTSAAARTMSPTHISEVHPS